MSQVRVRPGHEYEYGRGPILWLLCWFGLSTNTNTAGAVFVDCLGWLSCVQPGHEYKYGRATNTNTATALLLIVVLIFRVDCCVFRAAMAWFDCCVVCVISLLIISPPKPCPYPPLWWVDCCVLFVYFELMMGRYWVHRRSLEIGRISEIRRKWVFSQSNEGSCVSDESTYINCRRCGVEAPHQLWEKLERWLLLAQSSSK